jgi:malate dehydrogenase
MKISIIGAGNVGSLSALRIAQEGLGEVVLIDKIKGLAQGKVLDLEDACPLLKYNYNIKGTEDLGEIAGSSIIVITAGLPRKPGMSREELLEKNAQIIQDVCGQIKKIAAQAIVMVVTNPLDLMSYLALKITGFLPQKVFGMGVSLDAARFTNLIGRELNISNTEIEATVIGSHGEGMLPLPRFTRIKGVSLDKFMGKEDIEVLITRTKERGAEIVSLLGSGSAYFAPSAAIAELVRAIAKDEKRILGVSAYLNGEYGLKDICIGVPCRIGRNGIENIIELDLNKAEKGLLQKAVESLKTHVEALKKYC